MSFGITSKVKALATHGTGEATIWIRHHKTLDVIIQAFVLFAARTNHPSFVAFFLLVSTVVVAIIVDCPLLHVGKCALLALCRCILMVCRWFRDCCNWL